MVPFYLATKFSNSMFFIRVNSNSMYPTIMENDRLLVSKLYNDIKQNDIIVFYSNELDKILIKRVIATPGDVIYINEDLNLVINHDVVINNQNLGFDPYLYNDFINKKFIVPKDGYFVIGDNLDNSFDSRFWKQKFIYSDSILGKVSILLNPISRFRIFN